MKGLLSIITLLALPALARAQDVGVPMADVLRSNGKIYVVVTSVMLIFFGIIIFMISLDRKLRKLEKIQEQGNKNHA